MKIKIEKASGRSICRYHKCPRNDEFIAPSGRIRANTMCAVISAESASGWNTSYYCRSCVDLIHEDIKMHLNPKLWIFI